MEDKKAILTVEQNSLLDKYGYFAACLLAEGFKIKKIIFDFVGLYDTVASYGIYHGNDVEDLSLDAVKKAKFVLQLSSDDEYRENFDLTNIESAGLHGLELTLPGVHSDIGGSYVNNAKEVSVLYYKRESIYNKMIHHSDEEVQKLKKIVIDEGWYQDGQIKAGPLRKSDIDSKKTKKGTVEDSETYYSIIGTRQLFNTYDQIPLNLMFHFSKNYKVEYDEDILTKKHTINDPFINTVKNCIYNYTNDCVSLQNSYVELYNNEAMDKTSINSEYLLKLKRRSYLNFIDIDILKKLRNEYLHWSVKANEIGLGSRESQAPTKEGALEGRYRKREIHNG